MKVNRARGVIVLGRVDTRRWEDNGPDGYEFRRMVRDVATAMASARRAPVEIYAAASAGGWMADRIAVRAAIRDL